MGWRYRKSINIGGGTRLNIGSKSVGISTGRKGFRISSNSRTGSQVTVGIPKTGLSYRQRLSARRSRASASQNGEGWAWLMLGALLAPNAFGCVGLLLLLGGLLLIGIIGSAVSNALSVLIALYVGLLPLIAALIAAGIMIRFHLVPQPRRGTVAGSIVGAGLLVNGLFWVAAPARFPISAIQAILDRQKTASNSPSTQSKTATDSAAPAVAPAPSPSHPNRAPDAVKPVSPLRVLGSSYSIQPASSKKFSCAVFQEGRNLGVPRDLRPQLKTVRWRIRLQNTGKRRIASLAYRPEFLDAGKQPIERTLGLRAPDSSGPLTIRSSDYLDVPLASGEVRDVILRELVSKEAAEQLQSARIAFTATWQEAKVRN